jgi:Tfp pilus assembly protein PilN
MHNENLKPFKNTTAIFWATLGAAIVLIAAYIYLYYQIKTIGEHNTALSAETKILESQESEVGELKKSLSAIQARQPVLVSYFIDASDIVPFLETIEGYGRKTNVEAKFTTFVFKKAPDVLAVTMTATGSFTDLYHFMALLEAAPYSISMTNVDVQAKSLKGLQADDQSVGSTEWEAQISLAVTSITGVPKDVTNKK